MVSPPGRRPGGRWSSRKKIEEGFSLRVAGGGVLWAVGLAALLAVLASGVVYVTSLDERVLSWVVDVGSFAILGLSSFVTARRQAGYGLVYGLAIGGGYALITLLMGALFFRPLPGFGVFLKRLGFSLLAGAIGGILGVNT
ncbi:MAG: TIGR04086 family membrane protein [Bacillota bacterium]|jgi:putative membrane protein (TIGR04086 family)|nr:TIGR04086 family membrane protein [Candidatus Fermentithermobacillaceae bacterium]